jgi:ADP-dependent NAD(P)H-hydrate dehydratase / NAD(P)H-hydrate epimerase
MIRAYAVASIREAEALAISRLASAGLDEGELMSRAAQGLAEVASARLGGAGGRRVVALVGAGNNGGDAMYAAALLARDGATVVVVKVAEPVHENGLSAARDAGAVVLNTVGGSADDGGSADSAAEVSSVLSRAELVIDGIVGIGGRPGLSPQIEGLLGEVSETAYVLAVDLPSGADPDGEVATQSCVFADETVTFIAAKPVHLLPATEGAVGRLTVVDIGVDIGVDLGARIRTQPVVERVTPGDVWGLWPRPGPADDKYSRGVLGVVAGGENYTGAALLAVTSAVCSGAGMVRYVGPPTPTLLIRAQVPEAVIGQSRVQAWLIGPGLDAQDDSPQGKTQRVAAQSALDSGLPAVVDAGGLDLISEPRSTPTLLTPHAGELAVMLGRLERSQVAVDRSNVTSAPLTHARRLADLTGCTVLLKGATTLVVSPSSSNLAVRSQADAPPWLASAGSGDVLAGLAGMLLASGLSPLDAGSLAALVHGLAADAANPGGPVRALGVAQAIPGVVAALLAHRTARS